MGRFGQLSNSLSFLLSLLGFSYVVRSLGLPATLLVFPSLCLAATLLAYFAPSLPTLFLTTALLKALTYALNEPALEMLYLPTSNDVKFKAKAWIDVVGDEAGGRRAGYAKVAASDAADADRPWRRDLERLDSLDDDDELSDDDLDDDDDA